MALENETNEVNTRAAIIEQLKADIFAQVATLNSNMSAGYALKLRAEAAAGDAESGGGGTGPTTSYYPIIGADNRWFPSDAVFVPYSNRGNLQSIINANKRVRLEGRDYGITITRPDGSELYGIPGLSQVTTQTLVNNASNVISKGVAGEILLNSGTGTHKNCAFGASVGMAVTVNGGIFEDSVIMRAFHGGMNFNNATSGHSRNIRIFNSQTHGAGFGDGLPAMNFIGQSDFSSNNIVVFGGNHLTPNTNVLEAKYIDDLSIFCGDTERGPANQGYQTNGRPMYQITDCGTVRLRSLSGYDPLAPYPIGLTRVKNAFINNIVHGTPNATKFKFEGVDNLVFLPSVDSDRTVDDGLPGTSAKLRIMVAINAPYNIRYNGTSQNQLSGADVAAALRMVVEDTHQYARWADVVERGVPDALGATWQTIAANSPDMSAELQTLLNNAGVGGVANLTKFYYCSSTITLPANCALIGNGNTTSGIVMKSQAVPMFTYTFNDAGNTFIDLTMQGGKSFIFGGTAGVQYTGGFFLYCNIRDQAEAAIDLLYTYGWDNNYFEGCNFVNCGSVFRSNGRRTNPNGEDPEMSYMDKNIFMRCQFLDFNYAFQLRPKRASGGWSMFECGFFRSKLGVYDLDSNATDFQLINSLVKDCKATVGEKILFSYQPSPDSGFNYVGTTVENPEGNYLFHPGNKYEGMKFIKGSFAGKVFRPTPDTDTRDGSNTTIENCDFGTMPSGISSADVSTGNSVRSSYYLINTRLAATEDAALAGALTALTYNTKGTPDRGDDELIKQLNWVPGTPLPVTKLLRDRVV